MPANPKTELERDWKKRWQKAKADLDTARARVVSLKDDTASGPDGNYAHARAIMDEANALIEYSRVLRIYADLTVHGKVPDEAAGAKGK